MNPIRHIRVNVLGLSQHELAELVGVKQPTVSKWESGDLYPSTKEMGIIRARAAKLGAAWQDSWFFEAPAQ